MRKQRDEGAKAAHEQTVADRRDKRQRVAEMTPPINNAATTQVRPCRTVSLSLQLLVLCAFVQCAADQSASDGPGCTHQAAKYVRVLARYCAMIVANRRFVAASGKG